LKIKGLDNKEHVWNLTKYVGNQRRGCSEYHKRARKVLKELYPFDQILEEVPLPSTKLYADFYINSRKLMVEVQGEQHTKFTPFFHKNKQAFGQAKRRDNTKSEWCEINGITLVELSYEDNDNEWCAKLREV
jgi:hypothetical protein